MTIETETEAEKLRRVPGICFGDESYGRVPRVAGTGLQIFEIIGVYRDNGWDRDVLCEAFHWLTEAQIQAALVYYEAYPDEVNARLAEEDAITPETLYKLHPFMKPHQVT